MISQFDCCGTPIKWFQTNSSIIDKSSAREIIEDEEYIEKGLDHLIGHASKSSSRFPSHLSPYQVVILPLSTARYPNIDQ